MPEDNLINRLIDQFQIHSLLAEGPVASIYLAEDTEEQIQVALKIFPRNFFPPESLEAINQEIRAAAYLEHDLLVMPYACGLFDGHVYLAMPYAPGGSLRDLLASKKRLELDEVISVIKQVTMALDYMHKRGMNHRNIKPGNILLDGEGGVYLGDIGLPTVLNTVAVNLDLPVPSTPAYTAPEIAQGNLTARQSFDIYALGVVLFRMLTGHHPFEADNVTELLIHHINTPVPSILDDLPDSHPAIDRIVRQALAKNPRERFARAGDIADALTEAQQMSAAQYQAAEGMLPAEKPRLEEPGHSPRIRGFYGPALTLAQLPPGKRRRYLRQMARERRMQARDYRRSTISETRRQRMLIGGFVL
nr:serine/threonine protein kinase [Anaerolineae bacterium]